MGSAPSADLSLALASASKDEVKQTLSLLPKDDLNKLQIALQAVLAPQDTTGVVDSEDKPAVISVEPRPMVLKVSGIGCNTVPTYPTLEVLTTSLGHELLEMVAMHVNLPWFSFKLLFINSGQKKHIQIGDLKTLRSTLEELGVFAEADPGLTISGMMRGLPPTGWQEGETMLQYLSRVADMAKEERQSFGG